MFRRSAGVVILAALAFAGAGEARADRTGAYRPDLLHQIDCRHGMLGNCFGSDHDLFVDKLYRVSCGEAKNILQNRGFTRVKTTSCGGASFSFKALWKGKAYALKVSRSTGDLLSMKRVN